MGPSDSFRCGSSKHSIFYKERQLRRRRAAELLAGGLSPADAVSRLTAEWGCSRRTSLRDVNLGQDALLESID